MQFIKGNFKGKYKGKEVDPLRLSTFSSLHFLNVDTGATIKDCEWINDFRSNVFTGQSVSVNSIPQCDLYFNELSYPDTLPFRENLHNCLLINPKIYSILRKGDYTYGIIEAELYGIIGDKENVKELLPPPPVEKIIVEPLPLALSTLPVSISYPSPSFIPEKTSTWRWGSCLGSLACLIAFSWLFWWLLHHHGCASIPKRSHDNIPVHDTAVAPLNSDSIYLHPGNIVFSIYDWSVEDHDTISIYINDQLVQKDKELNKQVFSWSDNSLQQGDNELMIESINNGTTGPASPTIELNDGKNIKIFKASVFKGTPKTFHLILR